MTGTPAIDIHDEHAVQTGIVFIPLNKLKKSPDNARKTARPKAEIEALAASIHAKGVLQNLVVTPETDEFGARTGFFLVTIGEGRRLAQCLRVKRKQILDTEPIRCVIDTTNDALEISLDENVTRSAMSVMDEVEAFAGLVDGGMTIDDIARRFGCTLRLVEQRLALAHLSPKIRAAYRKGDINLDVARAFAINDDHAAQERVFRQFGKPITHAPSVRAALTAGRIPAHDKLARFVGADAYEAAGGRLSKDLFETDTVFFDDGEVLQRLASERLEGLRAQLTEEGWGWVEVQLLGHGHIDGCASERLHASQRKLKPAERKQRDALQQQLHDIEEKLEDDDDDALWLEQEALTAQLDALMEATKRFDPKLMAHAGAAVSVDRDGRPVITRGLIKRSDAKSIARLQKADAPQAAPSDDDEVEPGAAAEAGGPRLTKALVERLTQARTRGLRAALAANPHVALGLMVHVLMRQSAHRASVPGVAIAARPVGFEDDDGFERARSAVVEAAPEDELALLQSFLDQSAETLLEALAIFLSETLDFTHGGALSDDKRLQRMSDGLAAALKLDMTQHWEASEEFWQAAPKALALETIASASSVATLSERPRKDKLAAFAKMKKADLARATAQALRGAGWLPDLLVTPPRESAFVLTAAAVAALQQRESDAPAA